MTFCEAFESMNQDLMDCNNTLNKIGIFAEASMRQLNINMKKCELKVLTEAGTDEDLEMLKGVATDGIVGKISKSVKKIYDAVRDFINKIANKIKSTFRTKEAEDKLDEIEEKIKANPELKNKKINIPNGEASEGALRKGIDKIESLIAKVKGKKTITEKDVIEAEDIHDEATKAKKVAATATIAVTLVSAIAIFKVWSKKEAIEPDEKDIIDSCIVNEETSTTELVSYAGKIANAHGDMLKQFASVKVEMLNAIWKKMVAGLKGQGPVNESAEVTDTDEGFDPSAYLESVEEELTESNAHEAEFDIDSYLESVIDEATDVEESVTDDELTNASEAYLESLEAEVFGLMNETVEESADSDIVDSFEAEINAILRE